MASVGISAIKLIDSDGDALDDGAGKLNVNATLVAGATIDIGDVDMFLDGGTAILGGAGVVAAGVLRVTIADNDPHFGEVGAVSDADGTIHAQLRFLTDAMGTSGLTGPAKSMSIAGTRAAGALKEILVDSNGRLSVDVNSAPSTAVTNAGTFVVQEDGAALTALQKIDDIQDTIGTDGSTGPTKCLSIGGTAAGTLKEIAVNASGYVLVDLASASTGASGATVPFKIDAVGYNTGDVGIMAKVVCSDTLATLTNVTNGEISSLQVDTQGALYTTHGITGAASSKNTTVGTSIEDLSGSNVACKRVDMMASPDNTGYIWVGGTNTAVGQGIRLAPGDFYSVDIDNTEDIQVVASVNNEDISYVIYT